MKFGRTGKLVIVVFLFFGLFLVSQSASADDSDGDGLDDVWEFDYFGDTLQTASGDPDSDSLSNLDEQTAQTDPTDDDSDDDTFLDGQEVLYGTNPNDDMSFPSESLINISIKEPSWGVSVVSPFDLVIETSNASQCKYSTDSSTKFDDIDNSAQFFETTFGFEHTKEDFPASQYTDTVIYVFCKTTDEREYTNDDFPKQITLSLDPTEPVILEAYADPAFVIETLEVDLVAVTDDETVCRFLPPDTNLDEMEEAFEGINESEFSTTTELKLTEDSDPAIADKEDYIFIAVCINRADQTEFEFIEFSVDLSVPNELNETSPSGYITTDNAELRVITNKDSTCYYDNDYEGGTPFYLNSFPQENKKIHFLNRINLSEGNHLYPVMCRFEDASTMETFINFTVDTIRPVIGAIETGTKQCDNTYLGVDFSGNDSSGIDRYTVRLEESAGSILFETNTTKTSLEIEDLVLDTSKSYYVRINAKDKAGNVQTKKSSAVDLENVNASICSNLPPVLEVKAKLTEAGLRYTLSCSDEDGECKPIYYHYLNEGCGMCGSCNYTKYYIALIAENSTEVCYNISDDDGRNVIETIELSFEECGDDTDLCCNNKMATVSHRGNTSYVEDVDCDLTNIDSDGDGLSDVSEELCGLDPEDPEDVDKDNDEDGLTNGEECELGTDMDEEDTDGDGYSDYEEDDNGTDPNDADDYPIDSKTDTDRDRMPDMFEQRYSFLNPRDESDALEDEDQDGLTNVEEYRLNTDLDDPDSDGDGYTDYEERERGTDPNDDEDYPKSYAIQIILFLFGMISLGGGLVLIYKNPFESTKTPSTSKAIVDFDAAGKTMQQGMSVQPPKELNQNTQNNQEIKKELDQEIQKQKELMKLRKMSSVFDEFAEDSSGSSGSSKEKSKQRKKRSKIFDSLENLSDEDDEGNAFNEIERFSEK